MRSVRLPASVPAPPVPVGFALLPDARGLADVVALHERVHANHPSAFRLRAQEHSLPHLSLFQGCFETRHLPALRKGIGEAAKRHMQRPQRATLLPPALWLDKIVFADVAPPHSWRPLQEDIIRFAEPLRDPAAGSADPQPLRGLDGDEQASMDRFAYPFAGDAMRPHFTLGRLEVGAATWPATQAQLASHPLVGHDVTFTRLVAFRVGAFGSLDAVLAEAPLPTPEAKRRAWCAGFNLRWRERLVAVRALCRVRPKSTAA